MNSLILSLVYFDVTNVTESKDMSRERTSATSVFADILYGIQKNLVLLFLLKELKGVTLTFIFLNTFSNSTVT